MLVNKEWVDNLNEGDLVAIDVGGFRTTFYRISKIERITPKRLIKTSCGSTYNSDGMERGKSSSWDRATYLQPVTPEIKEHVERYKLLKKIKDTKFEELSIETLRKINDLI